MLTYKQFERETFNYLYQRYLENNSLTFSVRKIAKNNARDDYFIGTESSGYFAFTLWHIPVSYKGASIDLVTFVFKITNSGYKCYWQYHMSRDKTTRQNRLNLEFGKILCEKMKRRFSIDDHNSAKVFRFTEKGFTDMDISSFLLKLDLYIKNIAGTVDRAIKNANTLHPAWKGEKINRASFNKDLDRLKNRLGIIFSGDTKELFESQEEREVEKIKKSKKLRKTEKDSLIKSRLGQGKFRTDLISLWHSCAISGIKNDKLLRASHIKPWKVSTNEERLDKYNGLLLIPNYDLLFDRHLISFDDDGQIIISNKLSKAECSILDLNKKIRIDVKEKNKIYLAAHRNTYKLKNKS